MCRFEHTAMSNEGDYRRNAAATIQLARRAGSIADKGRLLSIAESWLDLADRAQALTRRRPPAGKLHPLVREKLAPRSER